LSFDPTHKTRFVVTGMGRHWGQLPEVHAVQVEEVFRNANEHVAARARELEVQSPIPFLCECSDPHCFSHILLTLDAYEHARAGPERYMTVPAHTVGGAALVAEDGRFALVEKL
jgi:hypothetical protein